MNWTSGYVADIDYTYGYYPELNPLRIELALSHYGLQAPKIENACELGFGQGVSLCFNSCHGSINWYGTDFNPTQALYAKNLSKHTEQEPIILDDDFLTFCERDDLPTFDFISLHGIWSWISDENRQIIMKFLKNKLAVGGVLYISYNTQPGWSTMIPFRDMLTRHANTMAAQGVGIVKRIDAALEFADKLMAANPSFKNANPQVQERLNLMKKQDRHYLAHEYFNADWHPMGFAEMNDILSTAKLTYAGSANFADTVPELNFTAEQLSIIAKIDDPVYREVIKDLCVNQSFRKDYWVKGAVRLSQYERGQNLSNINVSLVANTELIDMKVKGHLGEANMTSEIYEPLFSVLKKHPSISIRKICETLNGVVNDTQILEAIAVLLSKNSIALSMSDAEKNKAKQSTKRMNRHLVSGAVSKNEVNYLVSPLTLTGIPLSKFEQLFLKALDEKHKNAAEIAQYVWSLMKPQGHRVIKDGKTLESAEENIEYLNQEAEKFLATKVGLLRNLEVFPL